MKVRSYLGLVVVLFSALAASLYAQNRGTPSNLRVRVDANGLLLTASAAQTNPITSCQFINCRLSTDSSGNLLTVSSGGGGGVTNVATTSPISGGPITTTGTISCPTCTTTDGSFVTSSYTPSVPQLTIGNGSVVGTKMQIGKLVIWSVFITFGTTTALNGGNTTFTVSLPAAAISTNLALMNFFGVIYNNGSPDGGMALSAIPANTTSIGLAAFYGPDAITGTTGQLFKFTENSPGIQTVDSTVRIQVGGAYFAS